MDESFRNRQPLAERPVLSSEVVTESDTAEKTVQALHPIHGLPDDILYVVFDDLLKAAAEKTRCDGMNEDFISILSDRHPLWCLSHVCQRWRHLIVEAPVSWTSIYLKLANRWISGERIASLLSLVVSRSRDLPLHIVIFDPAGQLKRTDALDTLFSQSPRWRTFSVRTTLPGIQKLCKLPFADFGKLEALHLEWLDATGRLFEYEEDNEDLYSTPPGPMNVFKRAPMLKRVELITQYGRTSEWIDLPWEQVVDGQWEGMSLDPALAQLSSATAIEVATVKCFPPLTGQTIYSSTLRDLTIRTRPNIGAVVAALDLPCLESLHISTFCGTPFYDPVSMSLVPDDEPVTPGPLHAAAGARLKKLIIVTEVIDSGEHTLANGLERMLQSTPVLEHLELRLSSEWGHDTLVVLCNVLKSQQVLVPRLQTLIAVSRGQDEYRNTDGAGRISQNLVDMIKSRRLGVEKLERVEIEACQEVLRDVADAFDGLLRTGMKGSLVFRPYSE